MDFLVLIAGLLEAGAIGFVAFTLSKKMNSGAVQSSQNLIDEVEQKRTMSERFKALSAEMMNLEELKVKVRDVITARESLKAERGRVTITQAELETIEVRLRELDEIARELEASSIETKEEVKILQKKEKDLVSKNEQLRQQIADSLSQMDQLISQIEMSAQLQEQVAKMRAQLAKSEEQIQTLLDEIQQGNEQYFILKKRFDALDIEYAQLYEKFAEQQQ